MLIGGTEIPVSRKGFTLGEKTQEIGRGWVNGEEAEIESGNEKVCPKEVRREERNVSRKTTGVRWKGEGPTERHQRVEEAERRLRV